MRRDRDTWCDAFDAYDACAAPVLNFGEAARHPHNVERQTFVEIEGVRQPAPAPRFSRTPGAIVCSPPSPGQDTSEVLQELGLTRSAIEAMRESGAIF
jgi:alpha-methylacyl-CoA racemase